LLLRGVALVDFYETFDKFFLLILSEAVVPKATQH
jgi:hypothetical protein